MTENRIATGNATIEDVHRESVSPDPGCRYRTQADQSNPMPVT
jgi:hypothetical protein